MANTWLPKLKRVVIEVRDFLDEKAIGKVNRGPLSRFHRFAHFWLMVAKNFSRNRCPLRASALAYATLLAFIPMLAIALSISSAILKDDGERRINHYIDKVLADFAPPSPVETNETAAATTNGTNEEMVLTNSPAAESPAGSVATTPGRQKLVRQINEFIQHVRTGNFGVWGGLIFIFIAISMISRIEATFNDIWGVTKARGVVSQVVLYWSAISLGVLLLAVALGVAGGPRLAATHALAERVPLGSILLFKLLPAAVLCVAFAFFYQLMPNTKVQWQAALAGGLVGGILWHLNNYFSVLFVSRWVTNSKIYGSLAALPVLMVGMYFSWLILLFGAQVAYAWQNRAAYIQEKVCGNINQRGREFISLRLMQCVGQRFQRGERPATAPEMAEALMVPARLIQQLLQTLVTAGLVVEVIGGQETAYSPARPLEKISCHHILFALRAGQGEELTTRDDPARAEVFGEFEKIQEAERQAAAGVTVLDMVNRAGGPALADREPKAVTDGKA